MKFSVCMLVSRSNDLMRRALDSILKQEPDEIRIYIDSYVLKDETETVRAYLEDGGAKVFLQDHDPNIEDHHVDVVHSVHRGILEAENKWCCFIDDDDEILSDRRTLLNTFAGDDVGLIHGDVLALVEGTNPTFRRTHPVDIPRNSLRVIGSGTIYNRDAFREVHDLVDHGYFWDYKIAYWLKRAGYKIIYVPQILSIQNFNLQMSETRKKVAGTWFEVADELDRTPIQ